MWHLNSQAIKRASTSSRHQISLTLMHELGHYFGMTEKQLRDV